MKTIAYFYQRILISLVFVIVGCSQNSQFQLLDGRAQTLSDYQGQWLVVNFWAEWCSPCLKEIPELNRLAKSDPNQIAVIGVSFDNIFNQELKQKVDALGIEYPVMATEPVPILPFGLPASLPTNYIISPKGEIVAKLTGEQSFESLSRAIELAKKQKS